MFPGDVVVDDDVNDADMLFDFDFDFEFDFGTILQTVWISLQLERTKKTPLNITDISPKTPETFSAENVSGSVAIIPGETKMNENRRLPCYVQVAFVFVFLFHWKRLIEKNRTAK